MMFSTLMDRDCDSIEPSILITVQRKDPLPCNGSKAPPTKESNQ